MTVSTDSLK